MELALYNAVLTAMSVDGRKYTYVNQLASSDRNLAERNEWFKCCCCPPNIMRTLAIIGGYIYTQPSLGDKAGTRIAVHLYSSSTLHFATDGNDSQLTQTTDWPWDGKVEFELQTASKQVSISLRIPQWTSQWSVGVSSTATGWANFSQVDPKPSHHNLEKGYLTLSAEWLEQHPQFSLTIQQDLRILAPHPFTNQDNVALARGPIIYSVEDFDNPWVQDHFRSLQLDPDAQVSENLVTDPLTEERYIGLCVHNGASLLPQSKLHARPSIPWHSLVKTSAESEVVEDLHFIPYYFRSNRGGKGMSRTGIRRWIR